MASAQQARSSSGDRTASVRAEAGDDLTRVVLSGEVDAESERLLAQVGDDVVSRGLPITVDCSGVTFMDSTGVSFLALMASRAPSPVTLVDPPDIVRFLVDTTGIGPMVRIEPETPPA